MKNVLQLTLMLCASVLFFSCSSSEYASHIRKGDMISFRSDKPTKVLENKKVAKPSLISEQNNATNNVTEVVTASSAGVTNTIAVSSTMLERSTAIESKYSAPTKKIISQKLSLTQKIMQNKIAQKVKKASSAPIQKGTYLYTGIVLILVGILVGVVFSGLGYLIAVIGVVFVLLGLLGAG